MKKELSWLIWFFISGVCFGVMSANFYNFNSKAEQLLRDYKFCKGSLNCINELEQFREQWGFKRQYSEP